MKIEKISINGKVYSPDSAMISAMDQGLMYGVNAFESLRVHDGKAFLLDEHFNRLEKSLEVLGIKWGGDRKKYSSWIAQLCEDMPKGKDAFIRFVVTAGSEEFWVSDGEYFNPAIIIYRGHIPEFSPTPKKAVILKDTRRINPEYFNRTGFRIKSMDYVSARIAKLELKKSGPGLDGILLTPEGYVAEGLTSNIFWVRDGKLHTPPLHTGILAGTVRSYMMSENDIQETLAKTEELETADEIILSSGSSYLNPLSSLNGIEKPGINGPVFKKLYEQLLNAIKEKSQPL